MPETRDAPDDEPTTVVTDGPLPPERIGKYHIRRLIGSGGMGSVYEAIQEQPRRIVALKVMRSGIASRSSLRRFESESQILARLHHPGIAQVFEAGTHILPGADPVPYFAMEYVIHATPITEFARNRNLSLAQRLTLFARVCDAVAHGHAKGIIHRDLKPSNILVDSEGNPKIIDFGVARGVDSDIALTTLQTGVGQIIGTLQYMSPEQCLGEPSILDHRTDIYALGVILYELLCNDLPYEVGTAPVHEATRIVRESAPRRPATRDRTLRGDLETIILRAIHKEPARRYQAVADLRDDVNRYLKGESIIARRDSIGYLVAMRLRAAMRRNPAMAVILAALAAYAMALGLGSPGVLRATGIQRGFEAACALVAPPPAPFRDVRIVALTTDTPVKELADRLGLADVDPAYIPSIRLLYGKLLERLATLSPRVVAMDIMFRNPASVPGSPSYDSSIDPAEPIPFDEALATGVKALRQRGIPTVFCYPDFNLNAAGEPPLTRAVSGIALRGSAAGWAYERANWSVPVAIEHEGDAEPRSVLSLAVLAAWARPDALRFTVRMDPEHERILLHHWNPAGAERRMLGEPTEVGLTIGRFQPPTTEDEIQNARAGIRRGDMVAAFPLDPPSPEACRGATYDLARVLDGDPAAAGALRDKVVLIANLRDTRDMVAHPSGARMAGAYAQAAAIETLIQGNLRRAPGLPKHLAIVLVGALLGSLVARTGRGVR